MDVHSEKNVSFVRNVPRVSGSMVSVIIPTYNAGKEFGRVLESLKNQSVRPYQIIVVDSHSEDETVEIANSYNCDVSTIGESGFGHGKTRNFAASKSQTDFLVFMTQDAAAANEEMILELIKPMLLDPNIAICYGRHLVGEDASSLECLAREFNYPDKSALKTREQIRGTGLKTFFCSNCCSAIRRSTFERLGGFDDDAITNEDMLFGARAVLEGYSIYYCAQAQVYHSHDYSLCAKFGRYFKIGRFFAENKWLLRYAAVGSYGLMVLKSGVSKLWKKRCVFQIILLFIDSAIKAIAYRCGYCYQIICVFADCIAN